jgi:hypothetical protein
LAPIRDHKMTDFGARYLDLQEILTGNPYIVIVEGSQVYIPKKTMSDFSRFYELGVSVKTVF